MTKLRSTEIILDALLGHIDATGVRQKNVALTAGLKENYFSMLKKGKSRAGLARVLDLKRALPDLDEPELVASILSEMYEKDEYTEGERANVQKAIINLINFCNQQPPLEAEMLKIVDEVREEVGESGLPIPETLPWDIRDRIKELLKEAVQREAKAAYEAAHS